MKRFLVSGEVTISVSKVIRAKDEASARRKAESLTLPELCSFCSEAGHGDPEMWGLSGDLDGQPKVIRIQETTP